jgi:hypothetical protein
VLSGRIENMRAYGYEAWQPEDGPDNPTLLELREVTLLCSFEEIRRVARFVNDIVAKIDSGHFTGKLEGHVHFQDEDGNWTTEDADFIVAWRPQGA